MAQYFPALALREALFGDDVGKGVEKHGKV
jgi:hypothetical protein